MLCWQRGEPLEFLAVKPCKSDAYEAVPKMRLDLDLDECEMRLSRDGYEIVSNAGVMLTVSKNGLEITVYPHGRLLMHPMKNRDDAETQARNLYGVIGL
ncbi:MAG: hypothetical protein IH630_02730 [Thermoplasmata archaeon]|nr:hypothetical protein [Thermoplasmata archaeon]TFG69021.1 MAG: hypothetical protein E4H25_05140 [Methanomassiliicoccus sp.]